MVNKANIEMTCWTPMARLMNYWTDCKKQKTKQVCLQPANRMWAKQVSFWVSLMLPNFSCRKIPSTSLDPTQGSCMVCAWISSLSNSHLHSTQQPLLILESISPEPWEVGVLQWEEWRGWNHQQNYSIGRAILIPEAGVTDFKHVSWGKGEAGQITNCHDTTPVYLKTQCNIL